MFLSISKNACTSLKALLFELTYGRPYENADGFGIHDFWGYGEHPGRIIRRGNEAALREHINFCRFAAYRDPVERFLSVYYNKVLYPPQPHGFFSRHDILNLSLDRFIEVTEEVLKIDDPLQIDEHLRPQHQYYAASEVNHIVHIQNLDRYLFGEYGITGVPRLNRATGPNITPTRPQIDKIKQLYAQDYRIVPTIV